VSSRRRALLAGTARAVLRHRLGLGPVPLSVTIAPTNRCEGRCGYCGIWRGPHHGERPAAWWCALLDELHRRGCRRVGFTGGEPLLAEGLDAIAARARSLGMLVSCGTSGVHVPDRPELLAQLDYLVVSVDGPPELADAQRFAGAHDAAMAAIEAARSAGLPAWVTVVVTRRVAARLDGLLAWARQHRLRLNLQLPFHPEPYCGQDNEAVFPEPAQVVALLDRVRPLSRPGGLVLNSPAYWDHVARWAQLGTRRLEAPEPGDPRLPPCLAGRLFAHLEPDGRLYPCTHLVGAFDALEARPGGDMDRALSHSAAHGCRSCLSSYAWEQSLLFGLQPRAVLSWLGSLGPVLRASGG
jgi:MoaA/NifB/PqqE/SkfB family radical SAM enzyme